MVIILKLLHVTLYDGTTPSWCIIRAEQLRRAMTMKTNVRSYLGRQTARSVMNKITTMTDRSDYRGYSINRI